MDPLTAILNLITACLNLIAADRAKESDAHRQAREAVEIALLEHALALIKALPKPSIP